MTWDLGVRRTDWKAWIRQRLAATGSKQDAIARAIEAVSEHGKASEVSRFVNGDPAVVKAWFTQRVEWLDIFAEHVDVTPEEIRATFARLRDGDAPAASWNAAFPELGLEETEIATPFRLEDEVLDADKVVARWRKEVGTPAGRESDALALVAPPGSRRDIAAAQIRRALGDGIGVWQVLVTATKPERVPRVVRLAPWGRREAIALASRLAEASRLTLPMRAALRDYAALVARVADEDALTVSPDLHVRICAEVARSGCPADVRGVRRLLTAAAWRRATHGSERLATFDERLLECFFAAVARRPTSPTTPGPWWSLPRPEAVSLIGAVARGLAGEAAGRPLLQLVDEVAAEQGKGRAAAIERLRVALLVDPAENLLADLFASGILVERPGPRGPTVRPPEPELAAAWAARGLGEHVALDADRARLCDPEWIRLVGEQARAGLPFHAICSAVADVPPELAIEAALARVAHAASAPELIEDGVLVTSWADCLWTASHGFLQTSAWPERWGWAGAVRPLLAAVSRRYRFILPSMGDDPIATVEALVSPATRALVARWRPTPHEGQDGNHEPRKLWGVAGLYDHTSRFALMRALQDLSPDQFVASTPARWRLWQGKAEARAIERVMEEAERGDAGCVAMLVGSAWARLDPKHEDVQPSLRFWQEVPWDARVAWFIREPERGVPGAKIFAHLYRTAPDKEDPRIVELACAMGGEAIEWECRRALLGPLPGNLTSAQALTVAERLELVALLAEVADAPHTRASDLVPRLVHGWVHLAHMGIKPDDFGRLPLDEVLAQMDGRAEQASVALYRLGHPEPLLRRWKEPGPRLPVEALRFRTRYAGLHHLAGLPPAHWPARAVDVLAGLVPGPTVPPLLHLRGQRASTAWSLVEGVGKSFVDPRLSRALDGLAALLTAFPDPFPPLVDDLLGEVLGDLAGHVLQDPMGPYRDAERQSAAARALLSLGDPSPLQMWARGEHFEEDAQPCAEATRRAIERALGTDPDLALPAWKALERHAADRWPAEELQWQRRRLLTSGSAPRSGDDHPERPLSFVVEYALASEDPAEIEWLTDLNGRRPAWRSILRRGLARAQAPQTRDPRTWAWWALRLAEQLPSAPEAREAVRHWLLDDPEPWSGGTEWERIGDRYVGGAKELLNAALAVGEPRATEGLARVFHLALALPIGESSRIGDPPCPVTLRPWLDVTPWPLDVLADALVARGRPEVVLDGWRDPPDGPGSSPYDTRPETIRAWLNRWWNAHAPTAELKTHLWTPTAFRRAAAEELLRRGADLADDAERAALELEYPNWRLLAQQAPERLLATLRTRLEGPIPRELALAWFAEVALDVGAMEALVEVRRLVASLPGESA